MKRYSERSRRAESATAVERAVNLDSGGGSDKPAFAPLGSQAKSSRYIENPSALLSCWKTTQASPVPASGSS